MILFTIYVICGLAFFVAANAENGKERERNAICSLVWPFVTLSLIFGKLMK